MSLDKLNGDLRARLSVLLARATAWALTEEARVLASGTALTEEEQRIARSVGVAQPERIRVALVDAMPQPKEPLLQQAIAQTRMLGPDTRGLTLGHAIFMRRGEQSMRLLSHELRHVYQYEHAGSIAAFLSAYLSQILEVGYRDAPLEVDARAHECR